MIMNVLTGLIGTYGIIKRFWNETAVNVLSLADMIILMSIEATDIGMQEEGGWRTIDFEINFGVIPILCKRLPQTLQEELFHWNFNLDSPLRANMLLN